MTLNMNFTDAQNEHISVSAASSRPTKLSATVCPTKTQVFCNSFFLHQENNMRH